MSSWKTADSRSSKGRAIGVAVFAVLSAAAAATGRAQEKAASTVSAPATSAAAAAPAVVRLEAVGGTTTFQVGDVIRLELVFSNPGYVPDADPKPLTPIERARGMRRAREHIVNDSDYGDMSEKVNISPTDGVFEWRTQSGHDYGSAVELKDREIRIPVVLNQGFVFRKPGSYQVSVTTYRLDGKETTTDPIVLTLTPRSADEERALVQSLDAEIAKGGDGCKAAAERLAALPGDDAVRAKVRWMTGRNEVVGMVWPMMVDGLAASANYDLQLQLLEAVWHDPTRTPDGAVLGAMDATRMYREGRGEEGWHQMAAYKPPDEAHVADVQALADSLPQRTGEVRTETAYFLVGAGFGDSSKVRAAVRAAVVSEFGNMDAEEQGTLLRPERNWEFIRDPSLVPALKGMLDKPPGEDTDYGDALQRLIELDAGEAKPYAVREICDAKSGVQMKEMAALPNATLPETDGCLLDAMIANAGVDEPNGSPEEALEAARFASAAIYAEVLALYRAHPEWNDAVRGAVIAYLVRWHPETATELLPLGPGQADSLERVMYTFNEAVEARGGGYPEPLHVALRGWLAKGDDHDAAFALYELAEFGTKEDAALAVARLDRVAEQWKGREAELMAAHPTPAAQQAMELRQSLVLTLRQKDNAMQPDEAVRQHAKALCLGDDCARWSWPE